MIESPAPANWQRRLENQFKPDPNPTAGFVLLLAFLLRLWKASGTFLNFDEAMHLLAANKPSLAEAYQSSLTLAHPPLMILLLSVWRRLGTSELFLRLPSVIAGTIFCWIFFRWLTRLLGPVVGWVGFLLVSLLPVFIELSAEVRQYPLLLCFMMAAVFMLELALGENSAGKMAACLLFLYLAMVTHFSAILLAAEVGAYSLWRLLSDRPSRRVVAVWIAGQCGVLAILVFLYLTQISKLKGGPSAQHMQVLLAHSYFHPGRDRMIVFIFARTFGVLQFTFSQLVVGDIAGLLFVAGVFLLLRKKATLEHPQPSSPQLGVFLMLPFAINCLTAIFDLYPYGGTRHSAFLSPFAVAGVSLAIARLTRARVLLALGIAVLTIAVCQVLGAPHRPYMNREDQRRGNMTQAMNAIRQSVSQGGVIFIDFQTSFLLRFYLCPEATTAGLASDFRTYSCGGYRIISTNSETNVLTANLLLRRWNEIVSASNLKPGQPIWIFQAGWDIGLARELQEKSPQLHDLKGESFGRNISLFKLMVGQTQATAGI
jgi:hypothetical protein